MIQKQSEIDNRLFEIKSWYQQYFQLCGFCFHSVKGPGELAHLVRRSYSRELQTNKLNLVLCHHECHYIFDNDYQGAVYLPRALEILYIIWLLSPDYFSLIAPHFEQLSDAIAQFPDVEYRDIEHHGQILQLNYLYQ